MNPDYISHLPASLRDKDGELWHRNQDGRYACESGDSGFLADWPLESLDRVFGPITRADSSEATR